MKEKLIQRGLMDWQIDMIVNGTTLKTAQGIYKLRNNKLYLKRDQDKKVCLIKL